MEVHWTAAIGRCPLPRPIPRGCEGRCNDGGGRQRCGAAKAVLSFDPVSGTFSMQFRIKVENEAEIQGGVADTKYENLRIAFGNGTITSTSNEASASAPMARISPTMSAAAVTVP